MDRMKFHIPRRTGLQGKYFKALESVKEINFMYAVENGQNIFKCIRKGFFLKVALP